jgi:SulP family sulfate permease
MNNAVTSTFFEKARRFLTILDWLPSYKLSYIRWDLVAGITLASFVLPESMAYAALAGVPPEFGVYCVLAGGLFFALTTGTRQVVVGPTSAISLMVGTTVAVLSEGDLQRWAAIASLTALVIFILCVAAYLLKLSSLVSFISESVLLGFKAGAAITIITTQLPKFFGLHGGGGNIYDRIKTLIGHLPETNNSVLLFAIVALALLLAGNKLFPGRPVSLILVISSILVISFTGLSQQGFHLAGELPGGLPPLARPSLRFTDVDGILGLALGCFLVGYIETIAVARTMAEKNNYKIDPHQELLALGCANLGAAFASGYPVSGGMSQSTVNDKAGAKTPLALIICSLTLMLVLARFTHLLKNLPEVILAVVVTDAVLGLIKIKQLRELYQLSKMEFSVAMIAVAGVLVFGILKGVLIAAVSSIVIILVKSKLSYVGVLGQIPGTERFSDIHRNPENIETKNVKILRVESVILYYNSENVNEMLRRYTLDETIEMVILDMSSAPNIDVAGAKMLFEFSNYLKSRNIVLKIIEARGSVRDMLRKLGLEQVTGHISRRDSLAAELESFREGKFRPIL